MSLHRACCCGEPGSCCEVWCECPDEICVSSGTWFKTVELYSCDNPTTESYCGIPNGTLIGEWHHTIRVTGVKMTRVTNTPNPDECTGCCLYRVVQGEGQTGRIVTTSSSWFVNCLEKDGSDCVSGNRECSGTADVPLSGTVSGANGYFSELSGTLSTRCCSPSVCEDQNIKAVLSLVAEGNRVTGFDTDCCTQLTTQRTIGGKLGIGVTWDCRHRSRWAGTCPADLQFEPFTDTSAVISRIGCVGYVGTDCPCPTGPAYDYDSDCLATQSGTLFYCSTVTEGFIPIIGSGSATVVISGCT